MRLLIQRVTKASVTINGTIKSAIGNGILVLVGIENTDEQSDIDWSVRKLLNMRIFNDENEVMNKSVLDIDGEILVISQFTLHASTKKGNRPSYIKAAKPEISIPLYENFVASLESNFNKKVGTGEFGADMKVELINDGPVTIWIDSKEKY
jgi:D-tyrosyl-tRNA(Tyr) deacylase